MTIAVEIANRGQTIHVLQCRQVRDVEWVKPAETYDVPDYFGKYILDSNRSSYIRFLNRFAKQIFYIQIVLPEWIILPFYLYSPGIHIQKAQISTLRNWVRSEKDSAILFKRES